MSKHNGIFADLANNKGADFNFGGSALGSSKLNLSGTLVSPVATSEGGGLSDIIAQLDPFATGTEAVEFDLGDKAVVELFGLPCITDPKLLRAMALGSVNSAGITSQPLVTDGVYDDEAADIPIAVGGSATGLIDVTNDTDTYTVTLVAGQRYMFSLRGTGATALGDTFLEAFAPGGAAIGFDDDGGIGTNSLMTITAATSGTYTIRASAFANQGDEGTGQYTLDVRQMGADTVSSVTNSSSPMLSQGVTLGFRETSSGSAIASNGQDVDSYRVHLEAGKYYTFSVAGGADYNTDPDNMGIGEIDTVLLLINTAGTAVLTSNDDINFPGDVSSAIGFYATTTGDYYLQVRGYGQGNGAGGIPSLVGRNTGGYAIDFKEVDIGTLDPTDAIEWNSAANIPTVDVNGVPTAYIYFAAAGENFGENARAGDPTQPAGGGNGTLVSYGWTDYEKAQLMSAMQEYAKILGITYVETTNAAEATFRVITNSSLAYGAYAYPQDPAYGTQKGIMVFNVDNRGWNDDDANPAVTVDGLGKGGYAWSTILHEAGHAHGLSHPHDTGGGSQVMLGVTAAQGSLGLYDLNQQVYTQMSYNAGWIRHPDGSVTGTDPTGFRSDAGWEATLSAFDIAKLQERYGVTPASATGDTTYNLFDINAEGTWWETIYDTGGNDTIAYTGARGAQIDLLAATLDYTATGGGVVSFVHNLPGETAAQAIKGGYTIAGGVVIENATGGSGNDALLGNSVGNVLTGNAGNDTLMGRGGEDTFVGGAGNDTISGGEGTDDTAVYSGSRSDYSVNLLSPGVIQIVDLRDGSPDGTDSVDTVETIIFADGEYGVETDGSLTVRNHFPTASNLNATESFIEDTRLKLTTIEIVDNDSGDTITATLTLSDAAAGVLSTGTSGAVTATFVNGVWTASGAQADVNALLSKVKFQPAANFNGNFSIATSISDGVSAPVTGSKDFTGTAVNDAPAGADSTSAFVRSGNHIITAAEFGFSDAVDGNTLASVKITTLPSTGRLLLDGVKVTAGQEVSAADIIANKLVWQPAPASMGAASATLTFQVRDNGGTASGGVDLDASANTLTLGVINQAPTGSDSTVNVSLGVNHIVTAGEFGFADADGNAFASVTINTLPSVGRLTLNGAKVVAGQVISAADIAANKLVYMPGNSPSDLSLSSFTFQVHDNGGTGYGGADTDASANTLSFNNTPGRAPAALLQDDMAHVTFFEGSGSVSANDNASRDVAGTAVGDSVSRADLLHATASQGAGASFGDLVSKLIGDDASDDLGALVDTMVADTVHHSHDVVAVADLDLLPAIEHLSALPHAAGWVFDNHF